MDLRCGRYRCLKDKLNILYQLFNRRPINVEYETKINFWCKIKENKHNNLNIFHLVGINTRFLKSHCTSDVKEVINR